MTYTLRTLGVVIALLLSIAPVLPSITHAATQADSEEERVDWTRRYIGSSSELSRKINNLPDEADTDIYMPILFGVDVADISPNFGVPRSGGRTHEGEDIMAVKGTPIISPTEAVVLRTGTGPSEGLYVYTANPGDETFVYMHLDKIGEGVETGTLLEQGSLIGYVGNTGNASGGAAHLHFEIHDEEGDPTDPFPRITKDLTLQEKVDYLTEILDEADNEATLAALLVANFSATFTNASIAGIELPPSIIIALSTLPSGAGDLSLGATGDGVQALQTYLITANVGPNATRLAGTGATGYFGSMTKAALTEFQTYVGISPATGTYGPATRAYIISHPLTGIAPTVPVTPVATTPTPPSGGALVVLSRDLTINMTGEDVRALQKALNARGFIIATAGAGSPGNETTYFGTATEAAVKKFQIANSISPAAGYVGPLTRAALMK